MKPILFSIGPLHVFSYGAMVALGVLLALPMLLKRARQVEFLNKDLIYDLILVTLFSGFLGGRIFYVFQNIDYYASSPMSVFAIWEGGLVYQGGLISSVLGLMIFSKIKKLSVLEILDFLIPFVALVHMFGRIGCFLNGCCYGRVCDLPWAIHFPHLEKAVHPTQFYEAMFNLALFLYLFNQYKRKRFSGQVIASYFIFYGMGRFVIEFWRADNPMLLVFTWYQWISLGLILGGGLLYFYLKRKEIVHA